MNWEWYIQGYILLAISIACVITCTVASLFVGGGSNVIAVLVGLAGWMGACAGVVGVTLADQGWRYE